MITEALAPVPSTASTTVSKIGIPSTSLPPLPGVTPATIFVPYSRLRRAWNRPSRPVSPWTTTRVFSSMMIAISLGLLPVRPGGHPRSPGLGQFDGPAGRLQHRGRRHEPVLRVGGEDRPTLLGARAVEPHHHRNLHVDGREPVEDALGHQVAASDSAEDVDEHRPDL